MSDVTTTAGERFPLDEQRLLARLLYKRFGRNKEAFCDAWRRMMQNMAEDSDILQLLQEPRVRERRYLEGDVQRVSGRRYRIAYEHLSIPTCEEFRRLLRDLGTQAQNKARRAAFQPWLHP